jgi:hypothetical protein
LIALEAAAGRANERTTAAGRVYDKLRARLAPLVGEAGVELLFVRSAQLIEDEVDCFAAVDLLATDGPAQLRACLSAPEPRVTADSAVILFGTFLALLHTFIGERLTNQMLRSTWPKIDPPRGTKK